MRISIKVLILSFLFFVSCDSWLDVKPEGDSTESQIFKSGEGFRSVLNGLYKSMASYNLYGGNLQYGILDCMSQQYDLSQVKPMIGDNSFNKYIAAGKFDYADAYLKPVIDDIWASAFNVIANANSLIQNTEKVSSDLFFLGDVERNMILGEAYACRALMHFDMLRLFAPPLENDDNQPYVPYVETYPDVYASRIAVKPFLDKVIADLKHARELVMEFDTSALGRGGCATGKIRFLNESLPDLPGMEADPFFKGRGYRLNYYSITALLARVYQYAGRHKDAFDEAQKVMMFKTEGVSAVYPFFSNDDYSGIYAESDFTRKTDVKVLSNLIFAMYNEDLHLSNNFKSLFEASETQSIFTCLVSNYKDKKVFFNGTLDEYGKDYRGYCLIFQLRDNENYTICGKWYINNSNEKIRKNNITIFPVIRATEMRYIMAEYYARNNNFIEAQNILTEIRNNRGCTQPILINNWFSFVDALLNDAKREWMSEGQLFYLYKRLNANVNFGDEIRPLTRGEYLLPVPSNQIL